MWGGGGERWREGVSRTCTHSQKPYVRKNRCVQEAAGSVRPCLHSPALRRVGGKHLCLDLLLYRRLRGGSQGHGPGGVGSEGAPSCSREGEMLPGSAGGRQIGQRNGHSAQGCVLPVAKELEQPRHCHEGGRHAKEREGLQRVEV